MEHKDRKFTANYRIGEIANLLGMHPQTIRYYDKVGIVLPAEKNQKNERMYASYDVFMIMTRKQYQNMGFSVQETEKISYEDDLDTIEKKLKHKIAENQKELLKKQYYLYGMQQMQERIASIPIFYQKCFYKIRPARWHHLHLQKDILESSANARQARIIGMEAMPLCRHTLGIKQADIEGSDTAISTYCDLTLEKSYAAFYGFDQIPTAFLVEETPCIYTILKVDAYDSVKWSYLQYVQTFMESNQLVLDGDVQLMTIVNAFEKVDNPTKRERYRYFEAWIPFKQKQA